MKFPPRPCAQVGLGLLVAACFTTGAWAANGAFEASKNLQEDIDTAAQASQRKIDSLSEKARQMLAEYRSARDEAASLKIYNDQLAKLVESQNEEIASTETQLENIDDTQQQFVPFLVRAIDTLDEFVQRDLPFLADKRAKRIQDLRNLLDRADVTTAEKFRKIMEAYQTEIDYGRTIEAYRGELSLDGEQRSVQFLRVGRVALMYQSLNGRNTGHWNAQSAGWERLDGKYRSAVEKGLRIASEQAPPDLLRLPVPAPEAN